MGVDIHACAEKREGNQWVGIDNAEPFEWTRVSKSCYAFLAGIRNYWGLTPIAPPRGLPDDVSAAARNLYGDPDRPGSGDWHSGSWLTVAELAEFNYDATFQDKAATVEINGQPYYKLGGQLMDAQPDRIKTYRQFLGKDFFTELQRLKAIGAERIVFWFDN